MHEPWRSRMVRRFGPGVLAWCDAVPARAAELAAAWDLRLGEPFPDGNTSRVIASTRADGTAAVLKLAPERALVAAEAAALRAWERSGRVPRVLAAAEDALLLERVEPGQRLIDRARPASIDEVAALVRRLHRPAPAGAAFPPLVERLRFVYALVERRGADRGLVARGLAAAERLAAEPAAGEPVLLHGDLHAGNVLTGPPGRELVAIDPRPCVGDAAFDLVDWVLNDGDPERRARHLAAATGHDPERLLRWTRATAILAGPAVLSRPGAEERVDALLRDPG